MSHAMLGCSLEGKDAQGHNFQPTRLPPSKACDKVPFALYKRPASGFVRRGAPIGVRERRRPTPPRLTRSTS